MDWVSSFIMGKMGTTGLAIYLAIWLVQHFKPEERQAWVDLYHGVLDVFRNIPRRYRSERARLEAEYKATGRIEKSSAKVAVRVLTGTVEDVLNIVIDVVYIVVPFIVTGARKVKEFRTNGKK